jgi:hypothetical protein
MRWGSGKSGLSPDEFFRTGELLSSAGLIFDRFFPSVDLRRCRSVLGAFSTAPSLFTALAICICTLFGAPSTAVAQCNSSAGTTTCTDNPATFPNPAVGGAPTGGAAAASGDTTLTINSLTPGDNITPNSGVAGAGLVIAPGQASGGGGGIVGGSGSNGGSNPAEAINLQGTGITFQLNTTGAVGIDAQSIGQTGGTGGPASLSLQSALVGAAALVAPAAILPS